MKFDKSKLKYGFEEIEHYQLGNCCGIRVISNLELRPINMPPAPQYPYELFNKLAAKLKVPSWSYEARDIVYKSKEWKKAIEKYNKYKKEWDELWNSKPENVCVRRVRPATSTPATGRSRR